VYSDWEDVTSYGKAFQIFGQTSRKVDFTGATAALSTVSGVVVGSLF